MCVCLHRSKDNLGHGSLRAIHLSFQAGSLTGLEFTKKASLASCEPQGSSCACLPELGLQECIASDLSSEVFLLARQALSQLSHLLGPRLVFILPLICSINMASCAGVSGGLLNQLSPLIDGYAWHYLTTLPVKSTSSNMAWSVRTITFLMVRLCKTNHYSEIHKTNLHRVNVYL